MTARNFFSTHARKYQTPGLKPARIELTTLPWLHSNTHRPTDSVHRPVGIMKGLMVDVCCCCVLVLLPFWSVSASHRHSSFRTIDQNQRYALPCCSPVY